MIPSRLVQQYQAHCKETKFKPFGAATMLRTLSACSTTVRKSLQGLDYTSAAGAKGFDDLSALIGQLEEMGLSKEPANCWERSLKERKQYLNLDFKVKHPRLVKAILSYKKIFIHCQWIHMLYMKRFNLHYSYGERVSYNYLAERKCDESTSSTFITC